MSKRAMNIAGTRAKMSRDSALVMFFYMRLEKHVCNAMSHDLLLALAVVSFDHLITSTHSSDICCYLWSESESCRTSFAGDFFSILHSCIVMQLLSRDQMCFVEHCVCAMSVAHCRLH
jgi:hypothetical protein